MHKVNIAFVEALKAVSLKHWQSPRPLASWQWSCWVWALCPWASFGLGVGGLQVSSRYFLQQIPILAFP